MKQKLTGRELYDQIRREERERAERESERRRRFDRSEPEKTDPAAELLRRLNNQ